MKGTLLYFAFIFVQYISAINGDVDDIKVLPEEFYAIRNALDFEGKVVLISGSSSGIGATTARLFATLGAKVVVTGRNETRIQEVVSDCHKLSPCKLKPLGLQLDLTIPGNIGKLVNKTIKAYGTIDILVNSAGIGDFATIQDPNFNRVYTDVKTINQDAPTELTRLCAPYVTNTNGSVIFIGSILGRNPVTSTGAYSMGKNAIIALAKTLAHDFGPNVRVNVISPGIVDGTRIFRLFNPSPRPLLIENSIKCSTLRKPGVPMDIAKLIVFLASPLSSSLDGQELFADQGIYYPIL